MKTLNELEWLALVRHDDLDSEEIAALDYGLSVIEECEWAISLMKGYCPVIEGIVAERRDQYKADVLEMVK